uniref:Zer-1-like leucine-rich repeats region domain-containing protein n=1 Tax=Timema bartmani TaxID=61472 RepID=A0A7R9FB80_9NEOP|nr:unnamed protein product [Timema bartmani]
MQQKHMEDNECKRDKESGGHGNEVCREKTAREVKKEMGGADNRKCSKKSLQNINDRGDSIASLILGLSVNIFPDTLMSGIPCAQAINENICAYHKRGYILRTPNIRRLAIRNLFVEGKNLYFPVLVRPLHKLTHLDLSGCFNLGDLSYLCELPNLTSLVLHNVVGLQNALASLCNQKNLRHLDISQVVDKQGVYRCENHTLAMLVENLPNLVSLDISGTNLAGTALSCELSLSTKEAMRLL